MLHDCPRIDACASSNVAAGPGIVKANGRHLRGQHRAVALAHG
jgi:hypothetical protein